jgi:AcrR family transcriptional regulator
MARTAAAATARDVRRDAFVDAAQRLIQAKGYEQTSIQDVLDELDASRGAFYHYFDSKATLLDAVVDRMVEQAMIEVQPMVEAPGLDAPARIRVLFGGIAQWKGERTELLMTMLETWMDDDNALTRDKFRRSLVPRLVPVLARIIEQGNAEGSLDAGDPRSTATVLVSLIQGLNEMATQLFFARRAGTATLEEVERTFSGYADAFGRILGAPSEPFLPADPATLHHWFDSPTPAQEAR